MATIRYKKIATMLSTFFFILFPFLIRGIAMAGTVDLPRTGQTTSYAPGDDGAIQAGVPWPSPRFTDNGNGTVTDNLTGLMWLKDANCFGAKTWQEALDTVADFIPNPGKYNCQGYTASYTDWRLPNVNELESLVNAEKIFLYNWLESRGFTNVQGKYYWSSSTYADHVGYAWVVSMENGRVYNFKKAYVYDVWPVRAGQVGSLGNSVISVAPVWKTGQTTSYAPGDDGTNQAGVPWPSPRFTDNGDGTVTDNLTGLMWLKDGGCLGDRTWQRALDTVADFNANPGKYRCLKYTASYADWRLPNRKELHSLTDFSQDNPALPSGRPFTNVQESNYWSSSFHQNSIAGTAWYVYIWDGGVNSDFKDMPKSVWPVRAGRLFPRAQLPLLPPQPLPLPQQVPQQLASQQPLLPLLHPRQLLYLRQQQQQQQLLLLLLPFLRQQPLS